MFDDSTNSKYTICFQNLNSYEFNILNNAFPKDYFTIINLGKDINNIDVINKLYLLDKPDVFICDASIELPKSVKNILYESCCYLVNVSIYDLDNIKGNFFELSDETINITYKKNGIWISNNITKNAFAINKIIEICGLANIAKIQKLVTRGTNQIISNDKLEMELKNNNSENLVTREYLFKIALILNDFISFKDHYTADHCKRVALYSEALAIEIGLPSPDVEDIILAAYLHDIGKIALPDAIITKPSGLNDFEFDLMKKHVELGSSILPDNLFLNIRAAIRGHHEKYDGTGYPDNLAGDNIPLAAQILAIADSFDAMTSQRSYNKVKSAREALNDLFLNTISKDNGGYGVHYNPKLIKKFIKIISNSQTIMERLEEQQRDAERNYNKHVKIKRRNENGEF